MAFVKKLKLRHCKFFRRNGDEMVSSGGYLFDFFRGFVEDSEGKGKTKSTDQKTQ
jgi:hypothetical protein